MNRFFINYCSGARGDFLTNCLRDVEYDWTLLRLLENNAKLSTPISYCVKIHSNINQAVVTSIENFPKEFNSWQELFVNVNDFKLIKLKIIAESFEERLDVVWLSYSKVILNELGHISNLPQEEILNPDINLIKKLRDNLVIAAIDVIPVEQDLDKKFQHEYDYIIKFEDLFNAEYIRDLYKKINGRSMDYSRFRAIKQNIAMQYRLSKSEFFPMLKLRHDADIGTRESQY
jgi:hypothetical protein